MKIKRTMREMVQMIFDLREDPTPMTASELFRRIPGVKLSSLSSLLVKMVDEGELTRVKDFGPRSGYGYKLKGRSK